MQVIPMKRYNICFHLLSVVVLLNTALAFCENWKDTVEPNYQQAVIDYIENKMPYRNEGKTFAYCDFFGETPYNNGLTICAECSYLTYLLKYGQIISTGGGSFDGLFHVKTVDNNPSVDSMKWNLIAKYSSGFFPNRYYDRYLSHVKNPTPDFVSKRKENRERIISYFTPLMLKTRLVKVKPPDNRHDPHNHPVDIYSFMNLRDSYKYLTFVLLSDSARQHMKPGFGTTSSFKFDVWETADPNGRLYFRDRKQNDKVYEIVDQVTWRLSDIKWKDNSTLVFDQFNGVNPFDENKKAIPPDVYGVHFEVDLEKKKVVWAAPFGLLGFPERIPGDQ